MNCLRLALGKIRVLRNKCVCRFQDWRGGAAILLQGNDFGAREVVLEKRERCAGSATKTVNSLVGIADSEDVLIFAGKVLEEFDLGKVSVLKFVHQNEAGVLTFAGEQRRVGAQQSISAGDHMAEGAEILFTEHAFNLGEHTRDFTAAVEDFLVGKSGCLLGLADARNRQFAALHPLDVMSVFSRPHQLVLTAAHEVEKVVEEFADIGRNHEMLQIEVAETFSEKNPEIEVVKHTKLPAIADQQVVAVGVEGFNLHGLGVAAEFVS